MSTAHQNSVPINSINTEGVTPSQEFQLPLSMDNVESSRIHVQVVWSISLVLVVICLSIRFIRWISELMCKSHDEVLDEYFADLETEN